MFESLELLVGQKVDDLDTIKQHLEKFQYTHVKNVLVEGEYSQRGGVLDIYPANFDSPVRIDFDNDQIRSIASLNTVTNKPIWQHKIVLILPYKLRKRTFFTSDLPIDYFVDMLLT